MGVGEKRKTTYLHRRRANVIIGKDDVFGLELHINRSFPADEAAHS